MDSFIHQFILETQSHAQPRTELHYYAHCLTRSIPLGISESTCGREITDRHDCGFDLFTLACVCVVTRTPCWSTMWQVLTAVDNAIPLIQPLDEESLGECGLLQLLYVRFREQTTMH